MKSVFLSFGFIILFSCSGSIIEQDELKKIIEEIHLTKAKISLLNPKDTALSKQKAEEQYFRIISEKFDITQEMFDNSLKYYSEKQPKVLKNIYEELHKKYTAEVDSLVKKRI